MKSRALRFALNALFVVLLAAAAYVVWQKESEGIAATGAARSFDERARAVSRTLLEIKAAQPGYIAAGQGDDYWFAKVTALVTAARDGATALKAQARVAQSAAELDAAIADLEDFEQMDRRAREYVRGGQRLLASDLVFSDGIEKMDAAVAAVERARIGEDAAAGSAIAAQRGEQLVAIAGAAALGVLIMFALVPLPRPAAVVLAQRPMSSEPPAAREPASSTRRSAPHSIAPPPPPPNRVVAEEPPVRIAAPQPAPAKPAAPALDLAGIAALCSDLARVLDTRALPGALERAATLLNASGLVIWVADPDGRELTPVIAHGYPPHMVTRLGTIPKDAENATAAAFRTGVVQIVRGDAISHGAIAAPLPSPSGPVGVMAAELLQDGERREATRAAATIVAAQLATLMGPPARGQGKAEAVVRA